MAAKFNNVYDAIAACKDYQVVGISIDDELNCLEAFLRSEDGDAGEFCKMLANFDLTMTKGERMRVKKAAAAFRASLSSTQ